MHVLYSRCMWWNFKHKNSNHSRKGFSQQRKSKSNLKKSEVERMSSRRNGMCHNLPWIFFFFWSHCVVCPSVSVMNMLCSHAHRALQITVHKSVVLTLLLSRGLHFSCKSRESNLRTIHKKKTQTIHCTNTTLHALVLAVQREICRNRDSRRNPRLILLGGS